MAYESSKRCTRKASIYEGKTSIACQVQLHGGADYSVAEERLTSSFLKSRKSRTLPSQTAPSVWSYLLRYFANLAMAVKTFQLEPTELYQNSRGSCDSLVERRVPSASRALSLSGTF